MSVIGTLALQIRTLGNAELLVAPGKDGRRQGNNARDVLREAVDVHVVRKGVDVDFWVELLACRCNVVHGVACGEPVEGHGERAPLIESLALELRAGVSPLHLGCFSQATTKGRSSGQYFLTARSALARLARAKAEATSRATTTWPR